ncbi:poly hydrolase [Aspergillus ellipticus CBS 707.79]|uniref:Poly hydrolase n=1 Tax=Aspergillus ellipticus CBS 707.79 TaxID=1448320 RepID=A0A319E713_9EURO|nr:poly hydrolase [Aspergillus ellipticus CBS 707.79]
MNIPLTTAEVPPQFLKSAFLIGQIPQRALASDPRISYALYVPPTHYNPNPNQTPPTTTNNNNNNNNNSNSNNSNSNNNNNKPLLPLLIHIHGSSRNITPIRQSLVPFADTTPCAILSPLFPANLDHPNDLDSYTHLRSPTLRSDLALLSILDEVAHVWPGIDTREVFMMGFSGGGQFVHRFLYLYPERLSAVSVGAPGKVTVLDGGRDWPVGIRDVKGLFGREVEREKVAGVGIQMVVGGEDVKVHGGEEFWVWVRGLLKERGVKMGKVGEGKGEETGGGKEGEAGKGIKVMSQGRMESLRMLQRNWEEDGIQVRFDVVNGVGHYSPGVEDCVLGFLRPLMKRRE